MLTQRKVVDYLRAAPRPGAGRAATTRSRSSRAARRELVTPEEPDGVRLAIAAQPTLWGRIEFALYVAADRRPATPRRGRRAGRHDDHRRPRRARRVRPASRGRRGQVSGQIVFEALQQTAGRRAVLRDRDAFPVFRRRRASRRGRWSPERSSGSAARSTSRPPTALSDAVRRIFGRVLQGARRSRQPDAHAGRRRAGRGRRCSTALGATARATAHRDAAATADRPDAADELRPRRPTDPARRDAPTRRRGPSGTATPPPAVGRARSRARRGPQPLRRRRRRRPLQRPPRRLPAGQGRRGRAPRLPRHARRQGVRRLQQPARATPDDLAEEMVRMLVRVRRHLPKRR